MYWNQPLRYTIIGIYVDKRDKRIGIEEEGKHHDHRE